MNAIQHRHTYIVEVSRNLPNREGRAVRRMLLNVAAWSESEAERLAKIAHPGYRVEDVRKSGHHNMIIPVIGG